MAIFQRRPASVENRIQPTPQRGRKSPPASIAAWRCAGVISLDPAMYARVPAFVRNTPTDRGICRLRFGRNRPCTAKCSSEMGRKSTTRRIRDTPRKKTYTVLPRKRRHFSRFTCIVDSPGFPKRGWTPRGRRYRPPSSRPRFTTSVRFSEGGAQLIECRFVQTACSVDGDLPEALGLGGEPDRAPTATRQKLTARVDSRLEVRQRDLAGSCNVCESSGVPQKHTEGSGKPPALWAKTPVHREMQK